MTNEQLLETCTYWSLPEAERQELIDQTPKQPTWELDMRRLASGYWCFDYPSLKTYNELMIAGTELIMDHYYQDLTGTIPDEHSYMITKVSTEPLDVTHAVLVKLKDDEGDSGGATYKDLLTEMEGWLCGYLILLFGKAPDTLYVNLRPQL